MVKFFKKDLQSLTDKVNSVVQVLYLGKLLKN